MPPVLQTLLQDLSLVVIAPGVLRTSLLVLLGSLFVGVQTVKAELANFSEKRFPIFGEFLGEQG